MWWHETMQQFFHLPRPPVLAPLREIYQDQKRHYQTPNGVVLPSVTTVLAKSDKVKNLILERWQHKVGIEKATQIRNTAAARGHKLHEALNKYLNNDPTYATDLMADSLAMCRQLQGFLEAHVNTIHCLETPLYSLKLGVAGRVDCIAEWDGNLAVMDFKNSRAPRKANEILTYFLQITAYALMYSELTSYKVTEGLILMAVENDAPLLFHININEYVKPLLDAIQHYHTPKTNL